MQQPQDDADEVQLELAYFEIVEAGPPLTLLRLGGRWAGVDPADVVAPTLVLQADGEEHRLEALPEMHAGGPAGDDPPWRAAFAAPAGLAHAHSTSYALDIGRLVRLPHPFERRLGGEHAPPPAAPPPAPAGAQPAPPDEEPATPDEQAATPDDATAPALARPEPATADEEPAPPAAPASARASAPASVAEASPRPGGRRVDPRLVAGAVALVLALLVVIAVTTSGGGDEDDGGGQAATAPGAKPVTLRPVPVGGRAGGRAAGRITRDRSGHLVLHLTGLQGRRSGVWLFDSIIDSRPIGTVKGAEGQVGLPRADQLHRFRYIDVSREDDDNPNHSGRSVLRVATASVR